MAFKPTSTIGQKQKTVSRDGVDVDLIARGRHDPCVVPRAVPMVEAMVAIVLADQLLRVRVLTPCGVTGRMLIADADHVPMVEAMVAIVLADQVLRVRLSSPP